MEVLMGCGLGKWEKPVSPCRWEPGSGRPVHVGATSALWAPPGSPPARLPGSSGKGCLRSDSWREALQTQPEVRSAGRETHAVWRSRAVCPAPAGVPPGVPPGHVGRAQRRRPWRLLPRDVGPSSVSPQSCSECSSSDPPVASLLSLVLNWGLGDWRLPGQVPRPGCQLRALHLRGPSWGGAGSVGAQGRTLDASPRVSTALRALLTRVSLGDSCVRRTEASAGRGAVGHAPCPSGVRPPGWCPARFTPAPLLLVVSAGPGPGVTPAQQACCAHMSRSRASRAHRAGPAHGEGLLRSWDPAVPGRVHCICFRSDGADVH